MCCLILRRRLALSRDGNNFLVRIFSVVFRDAAPRILRGLREGSLSFGCTFCSLSRSQLALTRIT